MNWIRKTVIFVTLLIMGFFAAQANQISVQKTESQKTDTNFSKDYTDSLAFIQPQSNYHFAANIKTNYTTVVKWFHSLLAVVPYYLAVKSASNFSNQFFTQSKKVFLMLYPFHFFW
jgi:hypothetical protein